MDTILLTGDNYRLCSGLKVGDSGERVRELGYDPDGETYLEVAGFGGSAIIYMDNGVVTQIKVYDGIGRRVGAFFDP